MKYKTTQKAIRANYNKIICVPYCALQTMLSCESPVAYTVRREGWGADIYDMGGGVAIVTGYAPFGNVRPAYERVKAVEEQAKKIRFVSASLSNWGGPRDEKAALRKLQAAFVEEVQA